MSLFLFFQSKGDNLDKRTHTFFPLCLAVIFLNTSCGCVELAHPALHWYVPVTIKL